MGNKRDARLRMANNWSLALVCLLGMARASAAGPSGAAPTSALLAIQHGAQLAERSCYKYMHDDASDYAACLNTLLTGVRGNSTDAQRQRLGISYFAWVGANGSARMATPGADAAARAFLPKFAALQRSLRISDAQLCLSVAGDCAVRRAQIAQMDKELADASAPAHAARPPSH